MNASGLTILPEDNILILAPHPDDECIGAGGILALYAKQCTVIVATDGRYGDKSTEPIEMRAIRKREFENEMKHIGVRNYQMLDIPDRELALNEGCFSDIDFNFFSKIFIPWGDDLHPDHSACYQFVLRELHLRADKRSEIYQYEVHVPFHDFSHYADISEVISVKQELISEHRSQNAVHDYTVQAKALSKYRACQMENPDGFYEVFMKTEPDEDKTDRIAEYEIRMGIQQKKSSILLDWLQLKISGKSICAALYSKDIRSVAIYGMGAIGELLYYELEIDDIRVLYGIDRKVKTSATGLSIYAPDSSNPPVDGVIVTSFHGVDQTIKELKRIGHKNVITISELIGFADTSEK